MRITHKQRCFDSMIFSRRYKSKMIGFYFATFLMKFIFAKSTCHANLNFKKKINKIFINVQQCLLPGLKRQAQTWHVVFLTNTVILSWILMRSVMLSNVTHVTVMRKKAISRNLWYFKSSSLVTQPLFRAFPKDVDKVFHVSEDYHYIIGTQERATNGILGWGSVKIQYNTIAGSFWNVDKSLA